MASRTSELLPVLARINGSQRRWSLREAATAAAISPGHFQRLFSAELGESPLQYQRRLGLERGAAMLLSTDANVIDIAMAVGFESHEAFTRAFRSHFGIAPRAYRRQSPPVEPQAMRWVTSGGPCIGLYRVDLSANRKESPVTYHITRETLEEVPIVFGRRRVERQDLAAALAELLPAAYGYAVEFGLAMAGPPFVRYLDQSAAFFDIQAGIPLGEPTEVPKDRSDLFAGSLPAGPAAVTVHTGPYESLIDAHAALDRWMDQEGLKPSGGPWEVFETDPGEVPDPADWKTRVVWPLV